MIFIFANWIVIFFIFKKCVCVCKSACMHRGVLLECVSVYWREEEEGIGYTITGVTHGP